MTRAGPGPALEPGEVRSRQGQVTRDIVRDLAPMRRSSGVGEERRRRYITTASFLTDSAVRVLCKLL
jgi:hypothetical protein